MFNKAVWALNHNNEHNYVVLVAILIKSAQYLPTDEPVVFERDEETPLFYTNEDDVIENRKNYINDLFLLKEEKINGLINTKTYIKFLIDNDFPSNNAPNIHSLVIEPEKFNKFLESGNMDFTDLKYQGLYEYMENRKKSRKITENLDDFIKVRDKHQAYSSDKPSSYTSILDFLE